MTARMRRALPLVGLLATCAAAQSPLEQFVSDPALSGARVGVLVKDLATGEVRHEHDSDRGFMTASNMKLVSSATALLTLGPDFRFRTTLIGTRAVHEGTLDGDLVLVGSGDPTLGGRSEGKNPAAVFERLVDHMVKEHGLRRVTGRILGDDDCQPDEIMGEGWSWGYQGDAYAAQVSGLCFAENIAAAYLSGNAPGEVAKVSIVPATSYITITNQAVTSEPGGRTTFWSNRARATNRVTIGGRVPADASGLRERFSVENPTAYAAHVLRETLIAKGVRVDGPSLDADELKERPERYGDETLLATHESAPNRDMLIVLNKISQNLYAEQMIRAASRATVGQAGMRAASAHAKSALEKIGVDTKGMRIADGSGLTRLNLVKPAQLAALLEGMWKHEHKDVWLTTLPIAGVDGTLGRRFRDTKAKGRVRAKTGYISSVVALSGYALRKNENAKPIVFSILVNNFTCPTSATKAAVDRFVVSLVSD